MKQTGVHQKGQLTAKQKLFADTLLSDKKMTKKQAALLTLDTRNEMSAKNAASAMLKKPAVMAYLAKHSDRAESVLVEVMNTSIEYASDGGHVGAAYAGVARQSANDLLDRVHGKPVQSITTQSTQINLSIDLTGGKSGEIPREVLEQLDNV